MPIDDTRTAARLALACLDLTSLDEADTEADVERLCARAHGPHGDVAAVCVWPRLAARARACAPAPVRVAAVANFPDGGTDLDRVLRELGRIVDAGAQEADFVLPWRALAAGDERTCATLLEAVRRAGASLTLKVIVESGELRTPALVRRACDLALRAGADFIKTSTGKTPVGATPESARVMLEAVRDAGRTAGFKASGGIRTLADARLYLGLTEAVLGPEALAPARFRLGASRLLDDIEAALAGRADAPGQAAARDRGR
jgi:deoxyribose-phosphate aldolase